MKHHEQGTQNDKMYAKSSTGNTLNTPYNSFRPSAQIDQLLGIFLKKALITCPLSMEEGKANAMSLFLAQRQTNSILHKKKDTLARQSHHN